MPKKLTFQSRKKKPLWKIEDGITFSALSKWLDCREQFALQWIDGVTPRRLSIALEFGSVIHYALENQFKGPPEYVIGVITDHYRKYRYPTCKNSTERDTLDYLLSLAEVVFPRYCRYWEANDTYMVWIGREEKFEIPYPIVDMNGEERQLLLRGMRDGIYSNPENTIYGLFETKTKSKIMEQDILAALEYDMQTMMYCLCTYLSTGVYPNQITYNVIRRPDIYQRKEENQLDYLKRIGDDIDSRPEHYFKRYEADVTQDKITMFQEKTLTPILKLFVQWWDDIKKNPTPKADNGVEGRWSSKYHYLNSSALVGKYGRVEMWDAIFGDMRPYRIRSEVFPELEESFQVNWVEDEEEDDLW